MTEYRQISFEQLLRHNAVPNVEAELEVLSMNRYIEHDPDTFFDTTAREHETDVNNLMSAVRLGQILSDLGFSIESARVLAPEMIRRRIISLTRI